MSLEEKVRAGLKAHLHLIVSMNNCYNCPYNTADDGHATTLEECIKALFDDYEELISDMKGAIALLEAENEQSCK